MSDVGDCTYNFAHFTNYMAVINSYFLCHVKVKICHLSPGRERARELNVRRERKTYHELVKLIECISTSEEGPVFKTREEKLF